MSHIQKLYHTGMFIHTHTRTRTHNIKFQ